MRTLLDVKNEMSEILAKCKEEGIKRSQKTRMRKRMAFLRTIQLYIETCPDELFIAQEIHRIENRINLICNQFDSSQYKDPKPAQKQFEKEMGVETLRLQLRVLRFIKK